MGNITLPRNPETLAAVVFALRHSLNRAGLTLALHHGNAPGPWLDDLEEQCIHGIKTSSTDAPIETEAAIMRDAIAVLRFVFGEIRHELQNAAPPDPDDS